MSAYKVTIWVCDQRIVKSLCWGREEQEASKVKEGKSPTLSLDSFLHFFRESAKISQKRFTVNGHVRGLSLNAIMDSALILFGQPANMYINMCKNTLYTHQPFLSNCPRIQQLTVSKKNCTHSTFLDVSWALSERPCMMDLQERKECTYTIYSQSKEEKNLMLFPPSFLENFLYSSWCPAAAAALNVNSLIKFCVPPLIVSEL